MNLVEKLKKYYFTEPEYEVRVVDAPSDAQTFDKMIVVFANERAEAQWLAGLPRDGKPSRKIIRRVSLYNSKTDTTVGDY